MTQHKAAHAGAPAGAPSNAEPEVPDQHGSPASGEVADDAAAADAAANGGANAGPKTSRAGRNLPAAIAVGVALGALIIATLTIKRESFLVVLVVAICIGAWEMSQALRSAGLSIPVVPLLVGAVSMIVGAFFRGPEVLVVVLALTCLGMLVWRIADGLDGAAADLAGGFFVAFYPCFLGGFCALLLAEPDGHKRVFYFILVTVFSDIGGYAVGVLFGKHPMAPSLSPKKSWEGFAGSVAASAAVGAGGLVLLLDGLWWVGAVIGAIAAAVATIGDLIESSIKRDLGIKDMGKILPGHGGIMDRLDSLIMVLPVVWALLWWLVPASA